MPLIKHSPEFLAKREKRLAEKKQKEEENRKEQQAKLIENYMNQVREFRTMDLSDPDELEKYNLMLVTLARHNAPILEFLTLKEAEFLREILRFAKLSGKFSSTPEDYRLIESIQKKNYNNIFHIQSLNELGLINYKFNVRSRSERSR